MPQAKLHSKAFAGLEQFPIAYYQKCGIRIHHRDKRRNAQPTLRVLLVRHPTQKTNDLAIFLEVQQPARQSPLGKICKSFLVNTAIDDRKSFRFVPATLERFYLPTSSRANSGSGCRERVMRARL